MDEKERIDVNDASKDDKLNKDFSRKEREKYFKNKWRKEHVFDYVIGVIVTILVYIFLPKLFGLNSTVSLALIPLMLWITYGYLNNKMMIYVEGKLYEESHK